MLRPPPSVLPLLLAAVVVSAAPPRGAAAEPTAVDRAIARGTRFLGEQGQAADGSFSSQAGPAVTALVVSALVKSGSPVDDAVVRRGLDHVLSFRRDTGGIHTEDSPIANYETAIALLALLACNKDGRHDAEIEAAEGFLKGIQWDESEGLAPADVNYGGAGYGKKGRPDLSNTAFLVEALRGAGTEADDAAIQRAMVFVSRSQNLPGPHNELPFPEKNPDGGFYYTPANGGESMAGGTPGGGLRSYASMTYAGLKSMIFAGLGKDDPRVKAALEWLAKHYTFDENPGMGDSGLYYYYHTMGKALDVLGEETFTDAAGKEHRWREELAAALVARQREDGSWVNANARWMEDDPNLVTAYALLALAHARPRPAAAE
ncbi:MAG: prenyltransferase/squalene oxidase repeat-containing protein [Planctomycetaceae bacterium]